MWLRQGIFLSLCAIILPMKHKVVVVGGTNTDLSGESYSEIVEKDSNIGKVTFSPGGVGHNIALNLSLLGEDVSFITAIGGDVFGNVLKENLSLSMDISHSLFTTERSDIYLYVAAPNGDMYVAVNDMENIKRLDGEFIKGKRSVIETGECVLLEANLNSNTIEEVCKYAHGPVLADAVSTLKVERLIPSFEHIDVFKPNLMELEYLYGRKIDSNGELIKALHSLLDRGLGAVLLTLGKRGSVYASKSRLIYCPSRDVECVNTTGAGDSFLAGFAYGLLEWGDERKALGCATAASEITIKSPDTVSKEMKRESIYKIMKEIETYDEIPGLF